MRGQNIDEDFSENSLGAINDDFEDQDDDKDFRIVMSRKYIKPHHGEPHSKMTIDHAYL